MRTPDLVNRDLSRHLTDLDHQEAQERAVDSWLEQATPLKLESFIDGLETYARFRFFNHVLCLLIQQDNSYRIERIKGLIGEALKKEAAETEAADLA